MRSLRLCINVFSYIGCVALVFAVVYYLAFMPNFMSKSTGTASVADTAEISQRQSLKTAEKNLHTERQEHNSLKLKHQSTLEDLRHEREISSSKQNRKEETLEHVSPKAAQHSKDVAFERTHKKPLNDLKDVTWPNRTILFLASAVPGPRNTREHGGIFMRALDIPYILSTYAYDGPSFQVSWATCQEYTTSGVLAVIHVKTNCPRVAEGNVKHIWDPVDMNHEVRGGSVSLIKANPDKYWGYLVSNYKLKSRFETVGAKHVFVVPHQYSNFEERRKSGFTNEDKITVAFAGNEVPLFSKLARRLQTFMERIGKVVIVKKLKDVQYNASAAISVSDAYALRAQHVDVGVAWRQSFLESKRYDNSAQRMSNLMSVGVPTIGYAKYWAYEDLVEGAIYNKVALTEAELFKCIQNIIVNANEYALAQQEALRLAAKHSPFQIGHMYRSVFKEVLQSARY